LSGSVTIAPRRIPFGARIDSVVVAVTANDLGVADRPAGVRRRIRVTVRNDVRDLPADLPTWADDAESRHV